MRRHLILVVRRDRDFVISNHRLFRKLPVHYFVQHKLTVLAASAESYPVFASIVSLLIARPLLAFRAARAQPINSSCLCRLESQALGFFRLAARSSCWRPSGSRLADSSGKAASLIGQSRHRPHLRYANHQLVGEPVFNVLRPTYQAMI